MARLAAPSARARFNETPVRPTAKRSLTELAPKRTLFTHMSHGLAHEPTTAALPPGMELAYDGLSVPLV